MYFAAGQYQPGSHSGRWMLTPELVHVLQQRRGEQTAPGRLPAQGSHSRSAAREAAAWAASGGDEAGRTSVLQRTCSCGCHSLATPCPRRQAAGSTVVQRCHVETLSSAPAPPIVHRALAGPGRSLEPGVRAEFEAALGRDFSGVRVHTDVTAGESAQAVRALAYTVGRDIVFGRGQFTPATAGGRRLLGHELAHVVQQERGLAQAPLPGAVRVLDDPGLERDADRRGTAAAPAGLQPAKPGWSGSDPKDLNAGETSVGKIRRIPIQKLAQGHQEPAPAGAAPAGRGRAIVLLHKRFDPKQQADVMLFLHGHNAGYRPVGGVYQDRDVYKLEAQLESRNRPQLMGVLPQGSAGSEFGLTGKDKSFDSDAFMREVFATLTTLGVWAAPPQIGSVMLTGHSGAGELINERLLGAAPGSSLPSAVGTLREVALFDAVNGPNEFLALEKWLGDQLAADLATLTALPDRAAQLAYLASSMRFRAYFTDNEYYAKWHIGPLPAKDARMAGRLPLTQFLTDWFKANAAKLGGDTSDVYRALRRNYGVIPAGHKEHPDVVARGDRLAEALSLLPAREPGAVPAAGGAIPAALGEVLNATSTPVPAAVRDALEPGFHPAAAQARIHTGPAAARAAGSIAAAAFTVGRDVVFGSGRYEPESAEGLALLRHELAHVHQQRRWTDAGAALPQRIGPADDALEAEAERAAVDGAPPTGATRSASAAIQRAPPVDPRDVCETTKNPLPFKPGGCWYKDPAACPTYESWIKTFTLLKTFPARATPVTAEPNVPGAAEPHRFDVIGGSPAKRYESAAGLPDPAPPTGGERTGETFIDHPTEVWVRQCLPDNLRATAYQLPSDCADIAVILRHVWLAAHRRTEQFGKWTIGDSAGRPSAERVGKIIAEVYSGNVKQMVAPYSDRTGEPIRSFAVLEPLLHPGDVLVWAHYADVEHEVKRTGGHTLTIADITRDSSGKITRILGLEGNEPIFGTDPTDPQPDPAADDKGKIIAELKRKDTPALREQLGHAPGRRIETLALGPGDLHDKDVTSGKVTRPVWFWPNETLLIAAGPPMAARRPRRQPGAKKGDPLQDRQLTDWIGSFTKANADTLPGMFEAALLEARSILERATAIPADDARRTGAAAGQRFWALAKAASDPLDQSLLTRLPELLAMLRTIRDAANPQARAAVKTAFTEFEQAFVTAAIGAGDVRFGTGKAATALRMLLTGFGPFEGSGSLASPPPGTWNPSAAAVLALDGTQVQVGTEVGKPVLAGVEGIVLPVEYGVFDQGTVERVVRPLVTGEAPVDAIITVSQGGHTDDPTGPVKIERYAVGVRGDPPPGKGLRPVPAAPPDPIGPEIVEATAPVGEIAAATAQPAPKGKPKAAIPQPVVGEAITFHFATKDGANAALKALGLPPAAQPEVEIADEAALRQIAATMVRDPNGLDLTFKAGKQSFNARVVEGPGGNFLSNEISYRVLRALRAPGTAPGVTSFHVHTPLAEAVPSAGTVTSMKRREAVDRSNTLRTRLIATLRRIIAATGAIILARRKKARGGTP